MSFPQYGEMLKNPGGLLIDRQSEIAPASKIRCNYRTYTPMSASVIVVAGYLLLLFFVSSKPFSLILSIDVLST